MPTVTHARDGRHSANVSNAVRQCTTTNSVRRPMSVSAPNPPCIVAPREFPNLHLGWWCPRGGENAYYTVGCTGLLRPCNHSSVVLGDLRTKEFAGAPLSRRAREFWKPVPQECAVCSHPLKDACRGGRPAVADECYRSRRRVYPVRLLCGEPGATDSARHLQTDRGGRQRVREQRLLTGR